MGQANNEIRTPLLVSQQEAILGTRRGLILPGGRQITVTIPAGSLAGQEIRITDQGEIVFIFTLIISNLQQAPNAYTASPTPPPTPPLLGGSNATKDKRSQFVGFPLHGLPTPRPPSVEPNVQPHQIYSQPPGMQVPYAPSVEPNVHPSYPVYAQSTGIPYPIAQTTYPQAGQSRTDQPGARKAAKPRKRPSWLATGLVFLLLFIVATSVLFYLFDNYLPEQKKAYVTDTAQSEAASAMSTQEAATSSATQAEAAQTNATDTAIAPYIDAYNRIISENPTLSDSLSVPSPNNWETNTTCTFQNGSYHIIENHSGLFRDCFAQALTISNFAFQVQMNILKGNAGGIAFRANPTTGKLYLFLINVDGSYSLYYYPDSSGKTAMRLITGNSATFTQGYNQPNLITITAKGNALNFYMNKHYLASIQDNSVSTGKIGVIANYRNALTEVTYTQAKMWQL